MASENLEKVMATSSILDTEDAFTEVPSMVASMVDDQQHDQEKSNEKVDNEESKAEPGAPSGPPGEKCEIKALVLRYDRYGNEETIEKSNYGAPEPKPYSDWCLVAKQRFDSYGKYERTTLEINSRPILAALNEVVHYFPTGTPRFEDQAVFDSPYPLLQHHREALKEYALAKNEKIMNEHLDLLEFFLKSEDAEKGREAERMIKNGTVTFEHLWRIFIPGDLIYTKENGHERLLKLTGTSYGELSEMKFFEMTTSYTTCDGTDAGMSTLSVKLWERGEFVGTDPTPISSLSFVPLTLMPSCKSVKEKLYERGERYLKIRGVQTFNYDGLFLYLKSPPTEYYNPRDSYDGIWLPKTGVGHVVVDCKTFIEDLRQRKEEYYVPDEQRGTQGKGKWYDALQADPLLCPPYVYGFSLSLKEWCKFYIDNLEPVKWREYNVLDDLIIPTSQKRLIHSLVSSHAYPEKARDISKLKGRGLIILLHGPPGSGKTLTAELVAEYNRRPLLHISTGELGSWEQGLEDRLRKLLTYASIWQGVVLIDEADVFLESRNMESAVFGDDIARNSMVAMFLRHLEYFQGVLFMTSNRVQVFDPAIRSRIHLALKYDSPDVDCRRDLWKLHLNGLPLAVRQDLDINAAVECVCKEEMNGREIANAVNTAKTLAASESSGIRAEHLRIVVDVWGEFRGTLDDAGKKKLG